MYRVHQQKPGAQNFNSKEHLKRGKEGIYNSFYNVSLFKLCWASDLSTRFRIVTSFWTYHRNLTMISPDLSSQVHVGLIAT